MPEEVHHPDGGLEHPDVHREESDASFATILFLLLGAGIIGLFIFIGVTVFYTSWGARESAVKKSKFPLASAPSIDPRSRVRCLRVSRVSNKKIGWRASRGRTSTTG